MSWIVSLQRFWDQIQYAYDHHEITLIQLGQDHFLECSPLKIIVTHTSDLFLINFMIHKKYRNGHLHQNWQNIFLSG